jgi:23S rRNA (uracil1939-C5)-methyltransferase
VAGTLKPGPAVPLHIESLDHDGQGVAHREGKVIFVEGALPGEDVEASSWRRKSAFEFATVTQVLRESSQRVRPACPHFGTCGGCSMQHLDARAQVAAKQRVLEDNLARIGNVRPEAVLAPIHGPAWGYRSRARLSVRHVVRKGGVLVGFHEKRSSYVADMRECHVLPPRISALLVPLRELVQGLSIRERLPQVEVACGEDVDVLVLRILEPLTAQDEALLRAFAERHAVSLWLQPGGPATAQPFHSTDGAGLDYTLPEFGLRMPFAPTEFTQVNQGINRMLVRRALGLLDPRPGERVADMFCGLGNFTLPIASRGAQVLGIEGSEALVARAGANAAHNGLDGLARFAVRNLFELTPEDMAALGPFDRMLIDPPRDGALALVKALDGAPPGRIVYVSCNPATLARDAAVLVHVLGYRLEAAGVANMFPHTSHVESVALFTR